MRIRLPTGRRDARKFVRTYVPAECCAASDGSRDSRTEEASKPNFLDLTR